jgi:predicted PurR-regulated permease PerM
MEAVIILLFLFLGFVAFLILLASESSSSAQQMTEVKHNIEREKEAGIAAIDAATAAHKQQVFEVVRQANRQAVEAQAAQARRQAQQTVMNTRSNGDGSTNKS